MSAKTEDILVCLSEMAETIGILITSPASTTEGKGEQEDGMESEIWIDIIYVTVGVGRIRAWGGAGVTGHNMSIA